jgi:hypothetical protein
MASLSCHFLVGVIVDYGRWPKGNGTKPMSWGVAQGYDEDRRWRNNNGQIMWPPNTTNNPFGQRP